MKSEQFRPLLTARPPFVSIYLDDSRDTADAADQLAALWRSLRGELKDKDVSENILAGLDQAILYGRAGVGRQGRVVVAAKDGVLINTHLPSVPTESVLRVSEYPYVLPLVDADPWRPAYVFAAVDHAGANLTLHRDGDIRSETVDGGGYPVHKPVTAGWNGYGDLQRTTEEAVRMNVRAVAHRLTELVDETGAEVVFVCGEVRSRTDVVSALPARVASRVTQLHAGALGHRVGEDEMRELVSAEFQRRRLSEIDEAVDHFRSETGRRSGLAAEGLAPVCAALREGDVDTLILGDLKGATVVTGKGRTTVAPNSDVLSELGEAVSRVVPADEALPFAAIATGAALVRVHGDIAADGVAALLRYVPTDVVVDPGVSSSSSAREK
jgi:Bacterial archaeo-eukaryotic release factor family 2